MGQGRFVQIVVHGADHAIGRLFRGEEIDRKLVGVGAMRPGEQRTFALSVEIQPLDIGIN